MNGPKGEEEDEEDDDARSDDGSSGKNQDKVCEESTLGSIHLPTHCNLSVDASSVEAGDGVAERVPGDRGGGARRPRPGVQFNRHLIDILKITNMI